MFDRNEYEALSSKKKDDPRAQLMGMERAAVAASLLTGDAAWDQYLSYLQNALNMAVTARNATMAQLCDPRLVNTDEISARRIFVIRLDEQIRSLQWAMALPLEIKRIGSVAAERLKAIELTEDEQAA